MLMEPSHYLDSEVLHHTNYPEVSTVKNELVQLEDFFLTVNSALAAYTEGAQDKVYIDMNTVYEHIELCQRVLGILGMAEKPCFDIIMNLRFLLEECYTLVYLHRRYGTQYVYTDTPNTIERLGGGFVGN